MNEALTGAGVIGTEVVEAAGFGAVVVEAGEFGAGGFGATESVAATVWNCTGSKKFWATFVGSIV
jgi:hypothetical protein